MDAFQLIVLALIQGLTEFLPISSSAHLILPSQVLGWPDQGLAFDVAVHVGTLLAVCIYFRRDLWPLVVQGLNVLRGRITDEGRLAWTVVLATVPAGLAGVLLDHWIEAHLRSALVIAWATIGFGILLGVADRFHGGRDMRAMNWKHALAIGLAQALALIPGTSRSGITMTAALFLGYSRESAARYSFFMSVPIILAAGLLKTKDLVQQAQPVAWGDLGLGVVLSCLAALACIHLFMRFIERSGFMPYVIYRLLLGAALLLWVVG